MNNQALNYLPPTDTGIDLKRRLVQVIAKPESYNRNLVQAGFQQIAKLNWFFN